MGGPQVAPPRRMQSRRRTRRVRTLRVIEADADHLGRTMAEHLLEKLHAASQPEFPVVSRDQQGDRPFQMQMQFGLRQLRDERCHGHDALPDG